MTAFSLQRTLARPAAVSGFGYWSGRDVRIEFRPAPPEAGISFVRGDLASRPRVPARIEYRVEVPRRTNLRRGAAEVEMVEHVLAALAGLQIDNCEVWTDQPEMPGCDGSAAPFVDAILRAGVVEQDAAATTLEIDRPLRIVDGESWIEARPAEGKCRIEYQLQYARPACIGHQVARITLTPERFRKELASCRTFLLASEAEQLVKQGLGGRVTTRDLLVFDDKGPVANQLRFPNECARHKALDVLGDLALVGRRVAGQFIAYRSGHRLHAELTRELVAQSAAIALRASA